MSAAVHSFYLTFRLGEENFGVSVDRVLEIMEIPRITKIPCSPVFMRGGINLRDAVLPVIDMRTKFGWPETPDTISSCIIVIKVMLEGNELTIGIVADAVQEVTDVEKAAIQPAPGLGARYKTEFIEGMLKREEYFIMLLDPDRIFSIEEAFALQDSIENAGRES